MHTQTHTHTHLYVYTLIPFDFNYITEILSKLNSVNQFTKKEELVSVFS